MKKFLVAAVAVASAVTLTPAGFAATHGRVMTTDSRQTGVSRVGGKFVSRHQLESNVWAYRARTLKGFTRPASFATDKTETLAPAASSGSMSH